MKLYMKLSEKKKLKDEEVKKGEIGYLGGMCSNHIFQQPQYAYDSLPYTVEISQFLWKGI